MRNHYPYVGLVHDSLKQKLFIEKKNGIQFYYYLCEGVLMYSSVDILFGYLPMLLTPEL